MQKLRVHHMLCIPLFQGYGYSDGFSQNMEEKIKWLEEHEEESLKLCCEPDMICEKCPNLTKNQTCVDENNHVAEKDAKLWETMKLTLESEQWSEQHLYLAKEPDQQLVQQPVFPSYAVWKSIFQRKMTKEIFDQSCQNCQWYQKNLCSFEKWQKTLYVQQKKQVRK